MNSECLICFEQFALPSSFPFCFDCVLEHIKTRGNLSLSNDLIVTNQHLIEAFGTEKAEILLNLLGLKTYEDLNARFPKLKKFMFYVEDLHRLIDEDIKFVVRQIYNDLLVKNVKTSSNQKMTKAQAEGFKTNLRNAYNSVIKFYNEKKFNMIGRNNIYVIFNAYIKVAYMKFPDECYELINSVVNFDSCILKEFIDPKDLFNNTSEKIRHAFLEPNLQNCFDGVVIKDHCTICPDGLVCSDFRCNVCNKLQCPKCGVMFNGSHKCNPKDELERKAFKERFKVCPRCGTYVERISGCPDMWCKNCKVSFNWNTLEIYSKNRHNTDLFEYLDKIGEKIDDTLETTMETLRTVMDHYKFDTICICEVSKEAKDVLKIFNAFSDKIRSGFLEDVSVFDNNRMKFEQIVIRHLMSDFILSYKIDDKRIFAELNYWLNLKDAVDAIIVSLYYAVTSIGEFVQKRSRCASRQSDIAMYRLRVNQLKAHAIKLETKYKLGIINPKDFGIVIEDKAKQLSSSSSSSNSSSDSDSSSSSSSSTSSSDDYY